MRVLSILLLLLHFAHFFSTHDVVVVLCVCVGGRGGAGAGGGGSRKTTHLWCVGLCILFSKLRWSLMSCLVSSMFDCSNSVNQYPQTTTFEEKGKPKRNQTEVLLFTSLNVLPRTCVLTFTSLLVLDVGLYFTVEHYL